MTYTLQSHSTPLNRFARVARKEIDAAQEQQEQGEKKPSIKEQLAAKPVSGDQPAKPKDREER